MKNNTIKAKKKKIPKKAVQILIAFVEIHFYLIFTFIISKYKF